MTAEGQLQPRKRPRQRRSELTRDRILDAAVAVFSEYGYARGTTNRIAASADVSIGSLYQYFPNKDAIVVELASRHLDAGVRTADQSQPPYGPASLEQVIGDVVAAAIDNHRQDPEFLRVLVEQAPRSHELLVKVAQRRTESIEAMREILEAHPEVGVVDTEAAARLVVITIESVVHHALAAPRTLETADLSQQLVAMLTRYLAA
ncbi:TetR family transcriptional regulator [Mycolicibacterium canariasense]|uniref:TetR family transcriptional regulator n=1 Tax=Mycolicibacterium canariasense TaxID=228230 RepID=A0A117IAT2_MYCCR|nr:TetR/AcrR family transcriptional regulator [Mycolicibacterium canariasense]MCV7213274.1 TetR family transcriptional regulator [Mycolicibacterium canariasense]ORV05134.1 TetR family transcriptional regulator [Mycolicibacterium canariasense]GAS96855.1 TetR family transcriptional regulator [Mycolicibacterium canariasense]